MALTRQQKEKITEDLKEKIDKQKTIIFVGFKNLKTKDIFDLKKRLKEINSLFVVAKKTLIDLAFKEKNIKLDKEKLDGEIAIVFGFEDPILPAKTTYKFSRENENLKILGGYVTENQKSEFLESSQIIELAKIPTKEELLGRLISSINSPISGLVNVLQGNIKGLIYALSAIKK